MMVENVTGHTVADRRNYAGKYYSRCCKSYWRILFGTGRSILRIVIVDVKNTGGILFEIKQICTAKVFFRERVKYAEEYCLKWNNFYWGMLEIILGGSIRRGWRMWPTEEIFFDMWEKIVGNVIRVEEEMHGETLLNMRGKSMGLHYSL
jgi:hypothetical protein